MLASARIASNKAFFSLTFAGRTVKMTLFLKMKSLQTRRYPFTGQWSKWNMGFVLVLDYLIYFAFLAVAEY